MTVNTAHDADVLNAGALAPDVIRLAIRGGPGNDTLTASQANDLFTWEPGDGSDVIEGGPGSDTLQFNGSNAGEIISLTANGSRLSLLRNIGSIALDIAGVENVRHFARGGADTISFGNLSSTAVKRVDLDLASFTGPVGDEQPDTVLIKSLTGTQAITTAVAPGAMRITWSPLVISVAGVEPVHDRLVLQTPSPAVPAMVSSLGNEATITGDPDDALVRP
jgi:hypothetical protein